MKKKEYEVLRDKVFSLIDDILLNNDFKELILSISYVKKYFYEIKKCPESILVLNGVLGFYESKVGSDYEFVVNGIHDLNLCVTDRESTWFSPRLERFANK